MDRFLQHASVNVRWDTCSSLRTIHLNSVASFVRTIVKSVRISLTSVLLVKVLIKFCLKTDAPKTVRSTITLISWLSDALLVLWGANFAWIRPSAWNVHRITSWLMKIYVRQHVYWTNMDKRDCAKSVYILVRAVLVNQAVCHVSKGFTIKPNA